LFSASFIARPPARDERGNVRLCNAQRANAAGQGEPREGSRQAKAPDGLRRDPKPRSSLAKSQDARRCSSLAILAPGKCKDRTLD
jgi:hypothetical protein